MIYRVTLRSNPKVLVLFVVIVVLPAAGVLGLVYVEGLLRLIIPAVAFYLAYHLYRFVGSHLRSYVETSEEGLSCRTTVNEEISFRWDAVTHAGVGRGPRGQGTLFLYDEGEDKLLSIPGEYANWDRLQEELKQYTRGFQELALEGSETVQDRLRAVLGSDQG